MGLFDFMKPRWTAGNMTEEDRRRSFWLDKADTSYTAWKRSRDRYAVFVDLVERQCKEEPIGRMGPRELKGRLAGMQKLIDDGVFKQSDLNGMENFYVTKWDASFYADVLRGLALYDAGLARLAQGDRTVFQHNSRGAFEDAANCAEYYFKVIVHGGPHQDHHFYGKYVEAMRAALLWANQEAGLSAGGLQVPMANMSAPAIWREPQVIKGRHVPGTREELLRRTAHVTKLDPVPVPSVDVMVPTGQPAPHFGVYEAQVRDGLMMYFCEGAEMYRYGEPCHYPGGGQAITWKLLWVDDRYQDGVIPPEESEYFVNDEPVPDFSHWVGEEVLHEEAPRDVVITARTGEPAKYSGTWAVQSDIGGRIRWRKGDPMPTYKGSEVAWVFVPGV